MLHRKYRELHLQLTAGTPGRSSTNSGTKSCVHYGIDDREQKLLQNPGEQSVHDFHYIN